MTVNYAEIRTVRIICDGFLKTQVIDKIMELGASGYTWWEAHGKGRKELVDIYGGLDRLYLEVWCSIQTADEIVDYCESERFHNRGMSVGVEPILVQDTEIEKFT